MKTKIIKGSSTTWSAALSALPVALQLPRLGARRSTVESGGSDKPDRLPRDSAGTCLQRARGGLRAAQPLRERQRQSSRRSSTSIGPSKKTTNTSRTRRRELPQHDLAEGWAGPIGFATGLEWRNDEADTTHDLANQPWYTSYALTMVSTAAARSTCSRPTPRSRCRWPRSCRRTSRYGGRKTKRRARRGRSRPEPHSFTSWKVAAIYDPLDWLRFRTTVSHDVRAAGIPRALPAEGNQARRTRRIPGGRSTIPGTAAPPEAYLGTTGGNPQSRARGSRYDHVRRRSVVRSLAVLGGLVRDRLERRDRAGGRGAAPTRRRVLPGGAGVVCDE